VISGSGWPDALKVPFETFIVPKGTFEASHPDTGAGFSVRLGVGRCRGGR